MEEEGAGAAVAASGRAPAATEVTHHDRFTFLPSLSFVEFTRGSIRGRPPRARQFGVRSRVRSHDDDLACLLTSSCKFYKIAMILRTRGDKGMSGFVNAVSKGRNLKGFILLGRNHKRPHLNKIDFNFFQFRVPTGFVSRNNLIPSLLNCRHRWELRQHRARHWMLRQRVRRGRLGWLRRGRWRKG